MLNLVLIILGIALQTDYPITWEITVFGKDLQEEINISH